MDAVKFLSTDLILLKGYMKTYILFLAVIAFLSLINEAQFVINYMFFIVMIFAATPFSLETHEKSNRFYYTLPARLSSMVLGRYLYLALIFGVGLFISLVLNIFFYHRNGLAGMTVTTTYLSALVCFLFCLFQYPMYYKFGVEKGRITSILLYLIPAMLVFSLPSVLTDNGVKFINAVSYIAGQSYIIIPATTVFLLLLSVVSFKISCAVCESKEI